MNKRRFELPALLLAFSMVLNLISITPAQTKTNVSGGRTKKDDSQSLKGTDAMRELKRTGGYDSLNEAFEKASGMILSDPEPANLLAGGSLEQVGLSASDGAFNHRFGTSVDISGNTAVVGAFNTSTGGAAYVFFRSGLTWSFEQKLEGTGVVSGERFGYSVAIDRETIAVGAPYTTVSGKSRQGKVYVFVRSSTSWTQQQDFTGTDGDTDDYFGISVSISGDSIVAGANFDDVAPNLNQGSAYVFTRSAGTWSQQQKLTASGGGPNEQFGKSVTIHGNTVAIGSIDGVNSGTQEGAVYVYTRTGTSWSQQGAKLKPADVGSGDNFGYSLDMENDSLLIGSPYHNVQRGAAYVYVRSGGVWSPQQKLTASDSAVVDQFGTSVSISGDMAVIGSPNDTIGSNSGQGSAYPFKRIGTSWTEGSKLTATDGAAGESFGIAVGVSGDTLIVGAWLGKVSGVSQGSAKIFQTKVVSTPVTAGADGMSLDNFGYSIAVSQDTAVIGALRGSGPVASNQGAAYVFGRSGGVWTFAKKLVASDGDDGDEFGFSVAISGNTIVIGAPLAGNVVQGQAYVFTNSGSNWTEQKILSTPDGSIRDRFGYSVAIYNDTVVVGAESAGTESLQNPGFAYIFTRSGSVWSPVGAIEAQDMQDNARFGYSVGIWADTIVVGAYYYENGANTSQGAAYVFEKSGGVWIQKAKLMAFDGEAYDLFGSSVAISGNTIVVGAPQANPGGRDNQGAAYVFRGSGSSWPLEAKLTANEGVASDFLGNSVAVSGDTIVVGAWLDDIGQNSNHGSAVIFSRSGSSWSQQRTLIAPDRAPGDRFGSGVSISGATIGVGAALANPSAVNDAGAAHMYYWGPLRATAGGSNLSGRVLETNGRGLANATVILTDSTGVERTVQTGSFGRFSFSDLPSGETYIVSVRSRRFVFAPQVVSLQSDLSDVRLEASGKSGR